MLALVIHILAGSVGILSGFVAIFALKGAATHRKSGMIFLYAMLAMSMLGAFLAAARNAAPVSNIPVALLTAYLVITAFTTVRPAMPASRPIDLGLMTVALGVGVFLAGFGINSLVNPGAKKLGGFVVPFFVFAAIALLAAVGDMRLIRRGGVSTVRGSARIGRHLWRMSFALLIATFSFFLGQAKVIPKPYRIFPLLVIPPLVVLVTMIYWMWRIGVKRSTRRIVVTEPAHPGVAATL
jgi:uncharacterized membrane protein